MKTTTGLLALFSVLACFVAPVRADLIPPENQPCEFKQAGAACVLRDVAGTCQTRTCSRLDYAHWDRDASPSPPSTTYACLQCVVGSSTNTGTSSGTSSGTGTSSATVSATGTDTGSATVSATGTDTGSATVSATSTGTSSATVAATGTGTGSATVSATSTGTTPSTPAGPSPAARADDQEPPAQDDGACSIGGPVAKRIAPWLLAGAFSLLFLFSRRRKQR